MALLRSEPNQLLELTQPEMLDISRWINSEFAPRFSSPMAQKSQGLSFAAQELLSISAEISREFTPLTRGVAANLVLLPIDTQHLHAYWRIEQETPSVQSALNPPETMTLRIYTQPQLPLVSPVTEAPSPAWFDISIDPATRRQAVALPADTAYSGAFRAAIGVDRGEQEFMPILVSNNIEMPKPGLAEVPTGHEKAVLSAAISQFIIPVAPTSSPIGKPLC